ncbi:hypothetical protein C0J52_22517 [Blattella germanica]|nr:hypothetical protein C0J52_22517 [Blattella germanica]
MLEQWLMPQLETNFIYQQDGAPQRCTAIPENRLPNRWIGRASRVDMQLLCWPPRFPDITPCDFHLWGYVKDSVFCTPITGKSTRVTRPHHQRHCCNRHGYTSS